MADKYCDHGAYGAYAATPTWGQAQDGDGTAKTVGTPSTAQIVFTGIPSSGSIAVLGVTLTVSWATSADNCANLLAAAINAASGTATGPASFTVKSQVRNHVYARGPANGAPAGTCQIMTRQASASHAGLIAITHTLNNVSSPGTINFTGGTGGCWGYLANNSGTIWPSAIANMQYGLWTSYSQTSFTGALGPGDTVYVRSNKDIPNTGNEYITYYLLSPMGLPNNPVKFIVDSGTTWPEDGQSPVLRLYSKDTNGGNGAIYLGSVSGSCYAVIEAKKYSETQNGLELYGRTHYQQGGGSGAYFCPMGTIKLINASFIGYFASASPTAYTEAGVASPNFNVASTTNFAASEAIGCYFKSPFKITFRWGGTRGVRTKLYSPVFDNTGATVPQLGIMDLPSYNRYICTIIGGKFKGFVVGSKIASTYNNTSHLVLVNIVDTDFGNVTNHTLEMHKNPRYNDQSVHKSYTVTNKIGFGEFVYDCNDYLCEWNASFSYPTLNAKTIDGITPWSILLLPTTNTEYIFDANPAVTPELSKFNTLGDNILTTTVEFCTAKENLFTLRDVSLLINYIDSTTGRTITIESTREGPLTESTAPWTQLAIDPEDSKQRVTFNSGGIIYLDRYKFSLTTPTAVKSNTFITAIFRIHNKVATVNSVTFIDPELTVVAV